MGSAARYCVSAKTPTFKPIPLYFWRYGVYSKKKASPFIRELERKIPTGRLKSYAEVFGIFNRVLDQQRSDKDKIYSLHEPDVYCISKGKDHKKYEFGTKVSIAMTRES